MNYTNRDSCPPSVSNLIRANFASSQARFHYIPTPIVVCIFESSLSSEQVLDVVRSKMGDNIPVLGNNNDGISSVYIGSKDAFLNLYCWKVKQLL